MQKEGKNARQKRQKDAVTAEALGQPVVKHVPRTLENTREDDVTFVKEGDEDIAIEEDQDEFAAHFNNARPPHVLLTTSYKASGVMYQFCADLMVRPMIAPSHGTSRQAHALAPVSMCVHAQVNPTSAQALPIRERVDCDLTRSVAADRFSERCLLQAARPPGEEDRGACNKRWLHRCRCCE